MSISFLLDTSVLSESSKTKPNSGVIEFFMSAENLLIPAAALMELQMGITRIWETNPIKAVRLSAWYHKLTSGEIPIVDTSRAIAEVWGTLAADPRLKNLFVPRADARNPRSGQDLHIAAAALVHGAAIATFNVRDFLLIDSYYPLPGIYDPSQNIWHARSDILAKAEFAVP